MNNDKFFTVLKIIGIIAAIYTIYQLLQEVGLIKTKNDILAETVATEDVFTPKYKNELMNLLAKKLKVSKLTSQQISAAALSSGTNNFIKNELIKAKGIFNDDEEAIFNVFKNFQTQFQVMYFNEFFKATTKKDLFVFLYDFLDNDELARVVKTINAKQKV